MCLDIRISKTNKRIKNPIVGKKYIICYNKADKRGDNYYPLFCDNHYPYTDGWNESSRKFSVLFNNNNRRYVPHFHRFRNIKDAQHYHRYDNAEVLLKWLVPVDSITTVGLQNNMVVVITKKCKLLGEVR